MVLVTVFIALTSVLRSNSVVSVRSSSTLRRSNVKISIVISSCGANVMLLTSEPRE